VTSALVVVCAIAAGLWLANADVRTDDTGIVAMLVLGVALVLSALRPRMAPWIALAVGLPIPVLEIAAGAGWAPLAALAFASVGAAAGAFVGAQVRRSAKVA